MNCRASRDVTCSIVSDLTLELVGLASGIPSLTDGGRPFASGPGVAMFFDRLFREAVDGLLLVVKAIHPVRHALEHFLLNL